MFTVVTFRMRRFSRKVSGRTSALGNWIIASGAISERTARTRFSSPDSPAIKRMQPEARMKSPIASGLRMKTRNGVYSEQVVEEVLPT